jgi:ribosomal protein L24E
MIHRYLSFKRKIFCCLSTGILLCSLSVTGQRAVPDKATLFLEGEVSTNLSERDMAIAPDGSEMYYTIQGHKATFSVIVQRKRLKDGSWSQPAVASFSGKYSDIEPAFAPDGKKLFFCSNRTSAEKTKEDFDIWFVTRESSGWSKPQSAGPMINTDGNEFYPSPTMSGNLYFTAAYDKGIGKEDIYVSRWVDGNFTASVALDSAVNSPGYEFNAFVSPDEQFILFTSYGRKDDTGGGDLYISFKNKQGQWQPAKNLKIVNSESIDYCPFVSFDKKIMFFVSSKSERISEKPFNYQDVIKQSFSTLNGLDNIYWINFEKVLESVR